MAAAATRSVSLIPAGLRVVAVTTEVLVGLGTTNGLTSVLIGDGTLTNRWGMQTTLTVGARTGQVDFGLQEWPTYVAATSVVLSALGGTFDTTGEVEVTVWGFPLTHRGV